MTFSPPLLGLTYIHVLVSLTLHQSSEWGCVWGSHRTPAAGLPALGAVRCGDGAKTEPPNGLHLRSPWQRLLLLLAAAWAWFDPGQRLS